MKKTGSVSSQGRVKFCLDVTIYGVGRETTGRGYVGGDNSVR